MKTLNQYKQNHLCKTEKYLPNVNWCEICDVFVQLDNDIIRNEHEKGKKHQQNAKQIKFIDIYE